MLVNQRPRPHPGHGRGGGGEDAGRGPLRSPSNLSVGRFLSVPKCVGERR